MEKIPSLWLWFFPVSPTNSACWCPSVFCTDFTNNLHDFDKIHIPLLPGVRGKRTRAPFSFLIWTKLLVTQYRFPYQENRKDGPAVRIHLLRTQPFLSARHVKIDKTLATSLRCSRLGKEIRHGSRIWTECVEHVMGSGECWGRMRAPWIIAISVIPTVVTLGKPS